MLLPIYHPSTTIVVAVFAANKPLGRTQYRVGRAGWVQLGAGWVQLGAGWVQLGAGWVRLGAAGGPSCAQLVPGSWVCGLQPSVPGRGQRSAASALLSAAPAAAAGRQPPAARCP
jgi:hypothetical protein